MTPATKLSVIACTLLLSVAAPAAAADPPPRYRLATGQQITYRSESIFKYGEKDQAGEHDTRTDWTAWVVRANPDGGHRVVIRQVEVFSQTLKGKKQDEPAETRFIYADIAPDGRFLDNPTIRYHGQPEAVFPALPATAAEAAGGWVAARGDEQTVAKPVAGDGGFRFEAVSESPMNKIYLFSKKATYTFDPAKGLVTRAETESTQGYGFKGRGTGTIERVAVKTIETAEMAEFAADADRYFRAVEAYDDAALAAVRLSPDAAKERLAKAAADLKDAAGRVTQKDLRAGLDDKVKKHEQTARWQVDEAERRAKVVGKPAAAFETTDLDGKKVKLDDLRGRVVVLDFWYRGCGWCVKAMPQMNQLADDFAGQPVSILGMNTDRQESDARFVVEKMGLKYPTLKAEGLPPKFGVSGFPTLVIIDPQGKVHDLHVGYSATLRQDVGTTIRELLAKK
jgi:peroxiredoxin